MATSEWVDRFAVWNGLHPDLQTLLMYALGIALYTALVFTFYHNIARRDPFHSEAGRGWWGKVVHHAETILTFPIVSFGYFAVLAISLFVLSKPTTGTQQILLLSMAAVLGVRVTAHVSERMADDIAKLMPLSLLAVVLVDPGYLSLGSTVSRIGETVLMAPVLAQYFVLFIIVEAIMRGVHGLFPGARAFVQRVEHRRSVSKKAMLRTIEADHAGHHKAPKERGSFHAHGPRDRSRDWITLDERNTARPGSRQGAGPALRAEQAARAPPPRSPTPRAGPGS